MRDIAYERDMLAIQRALQVYIEAFIGMARYLVQQRYQLSVSQSREALDELKNRGDLSTEKHQEKKIIGFRNILVHDYLDINEDVVKAINEQGLYLQLQEQIDKWHTMLH